MDRVGHSRRKIVSGVLALCAAAGGGPVAALPDELRFGLTPVFLTSDLELLARLRAYLERATERPVRLITRRTYQEITSLLLSSQLDAAWICGFPFVQYRQRLALVAVPVWRGKPLYRSYLIAGRARQATGLDDLKGDVHAFSDPDSNSGWLVTATALAKQNQTPDRFFGQTIFTYGHRNVVRAVSSGLAMSGSVDGYVYEVMRETEPALIAETRVVQQSELLGFPPIACAAATADESRTKRLQAALIGMGNDLDGRAVLQMLRLDGFSVEDPSLFDTIAAEVAIVRGASG
jgi:phosphonate transport system substrate-binding protein